MSSEEVAELAKAIHNHADVLYESWKKGQEAFSMKRMEDTLELLADPSLTPKLEDFVSTFVANDFARQAKRQQFHNLHPSDDENQQRESSPGAPRKPLPKSILAVVQRFEPQQQSSPPPNNNPLHSPRERSPAIGESLVRFHVPGVGPVSKNVVWAESINKHNSSERTSIARSPSPTPVNINNYLDNGSNHVPKPQNQPQPLNGKNNGKTKTIISPATGKIVIERHIPIERVDDHEVTAAKINSIQTPSTRFSPGRNVANKNENLNPPNYSKALKQEEEKLLRALQTGQVLSSKNSTTNNVNSSIPPREKISPTDISSHNNHNSRVAFAKERIRQSQENPMTQQRLELQKRLRFPNGNLAAAIALQQGKLKFQPSNNWNLNNAAHCAPLVDEVDLSGHNGHHRESGRNSFVRFGPGATVADRVQLFEKYPTPPISHSSNSKSPSPIRTNAHVITHPIHIQHSNDSHFNIRDGHPSELFHNDKSHYLPIVNNNNLSANSSAPWRTSPGKDVLLQNSHLQPTELTSPVRKQAVPSPSPTLNRRSNADTPRSAKDVPRFFWPEGKPSSNTFVQDSLAKAEEKLKQMNNCVNYNKFGEVLVACGIPLYWKRPYWMALCLSPEATCTAKMFIPFLRYLLTECPDDAARFIRIVSSASRNYPGGYDNKNSYNNNNTQMNIKYYINHGNFCQDLKYIELTMSDFVSMMQDIIDTHPGLGFLREAPEFHSRYITTVISRIFYKVNRSWSGRLTLTEIRRSNLLRIIKRLEEESDINAITEYFSYEHFYVIYCKFWELDKDHDLLIDKHDLASHADNVLSSRIIDRIFSGTVLRGWDVSNPGRASKDKMTYSDFVWFLLSEEDKKTSTSIEYWFRCLDIDGDGIISPYELQYFYSEQESRIASLGIEPLPYSNVYCQIVDMLHCSPKGIRLSDLKRNPHLAANVFNTVFNLDKYLEHEQRDPFAAAASLENGESDWDKYASAEYDLLIAEENPSDHLNDSGVEELLTP